jgi:hypothetical protein
MPTIEEIKELLEKVKQKHLLRNKEVHRPSPLPPMSPFSCTPNAGRVNIIKVLREGKTEKKVTTSKELTDEVISDIRFSGH